VPANRGLLAHSPHRNPANWDVLKQEKCNMSATPFDPARPLHPSTLRRKPASKREFDTDAVCALREMEQWGAWPDEQLKGLFIHIGPNKCV
jgi:hypothetical protein